MASVACSPEDLRRLADLLANNKIGEVKVDLDPHSSPTEAGNPIIAETRRKLSVLGIRTMRGAFGPEFTARVLTPLTIVINKYESFRSGQFKAFMEALSPMGIDNRIKRAIGVSAKHNEALYKAVMNLDDNNKYIGPNAAVESGVLEAARNINSILKRVGEEHGIRASMYKEYRRAIDANGGKGGLMYGDSPWSKAFKAAHQGDEAAFFWEVERQGIPRNWEPTMTAMYQDFVNTIAAKRILTPQLTALEDEVVKPFFNVRFRRHVLGLGKYSQDKIGYDMWVNLKDHIYGQPTDLDRKIASAWDRLFNATGTSARTTPSDVYRMGAMVSNLFYGGVLSTPGAIIRQVFQLVPSMAELGVRPVVQGMFKLFEPGYAQKLLQRGILAPPLEAIHEQVALARSMGRAVHKMTETALYVFDASDRAMRVITAGAAEVKFGEALARGRDMASLRASKEIKEQIQKLVARGREKEALDIYMMDVVANTQFVYGRVNRPELMRGVVGQSLGMLQSYPLNWIEMYANFGRRFARGAQGALGRGEESWTEMLPLMRQLGLVTGLMMGGAQAFGTDLSSNFISFPGQAPVPQTASALLTSGKTNFDWLFGSVFGVGETDYHKRLRSEANNQLVRQASNFIPGGLLAKKTSDVVDEPTFVNVMRLMGFPPMAEEINLEIRAKAAKTRREKQFERLYD